MQEVTEPTVIRFPGRSVRVPATFLRCGACGKELWRPEQVEAAHRAAATIVRQTENLLMPEEIRAIRKDLKLTQGKFEELIGAGKKTVTRWETGEVFQSRVADEIMRVVRDVPGAASYLAKRRGISIPVQVDEVANALMDLILSNSQSAAIEFEEEIVTERTTRVRYSHGRNPFSRNRPRRFTQV